MGSITVYLAPPMHDHAAKYWTVSCSRFPFHSSHIPTHEACACAVRPAPLPVWLQAHADRNAN
eukprot:3668521-Prymnesium_polylepis.1